MSAREVIVSATDPSEAQKSVNPFGFLFPREVAGIGIPPRRRRKLWELNDKHLCPVIGTCLPIGELRKFIAKFLIATNARSEYEMHVTAVNHIDKRNEFSEAIHKHLEKKFRSVVLIFEKAENDLEVMQLWRDFSRNGEVASALWAAVTHHKISATSEQEIFADVHMLSHQLGAGQAADSRKLSRLEKENESLKAELEKERSRTARLEAELREQTQQLSVEKDRLLPLKSELALLQERLEIFRSLTVIEENQRKELALQRANEEITRSSHRNWSLEKNLKAAHEELAVMASERSILQMERDALQRMIEAFYSIDDDNGCDKQCITCEMAQSSQCILCVGGRHSLVSAYRSLAQRIGVRLIHHDGGVEESLSRLPDMIAGADAVLCPTDCVSHSAYYQVKKQCKQSDKPCLLFKGAGVSGFAVALARLTSGQTSLPRSALMSN